MSDQQHNADDNIPRFISPDSTVYPREYALWLKDVKSRYRQSQCKAAVKVNAELLQFYWQLGRDIVSMRVEEQWGKGVMNRLSLDLRQAFPGQTGFSVTNLKYTKRWYLFYNQSDTIRHQVGDELCPPERFMLIPWKHHVFIFTKCKTVSEALFYIDRTVVVNRTVEELEDRSSKLR